MLIDDFATDINSKYYNQNVDLSSYKKQLRKYKNKKKEYLKIKMKQWIFLFKKYFKIQKIYRCILFLKNDFQFIKFICLFVFKIL